MLRHIELLLLISLTAFSSSLFADQVTLKNGDRLTGTVVKSDGKTLVLHTDAADDVTLKMDAVQEIKTLAADLSTSIAEKILRRKITVEDQRALVESSLEQLQRVKAN